MFIKCEKRSKLIFLLYRSRLTSSSLSLLSLSVGEHTRCKETNEERERRENKRCFSCSGGNIHPFFAPVVIMSPTARISSPRTCACCPSATYRPSPREQGSIEKCFSPTPHTCGTRQSKRLLKKTIEKTEKCFSRSTPHLRDPRRGISVDGRSALPLAYPIILVILVTIVTIVTPITLVIDIIIVIICN